MTCAIVGFGNIALAHLKHYVDTGIVSVVAIADPSPARRQLAESLIPGVLACGTMEELAESTRVDIVDICTPPAMHLDQVAMGLEMGCHVLCEKPLFLSVRDLTRVRSKLERSPGVLVPCHNYKAAPVFRSMKRIVQAPEFGPFVAGHFRVMRTSHAQGVDDWHPDWRRDPATSGGGVLRDHGTHCAYLAPFLIGGLPTRVSCVALDTAQDRSRLSATGSEDVVFLTLEFAGGANMTMDLSWRGGVRQTTYALFGEHQAVIASSEGLLHVGRRDGALKWRADTGFDDSTHPEWFSDTFRDFLDVVARPERQSAALREAVMTAAIIECAYESARRDGTWITIPRLDEELGIVGAGEGLKQ